MIFPDIIPRIPFGIPQGFLELDNSFTYMFRNSSKDLKFSVQELFQEFLQQFFRISQENLSTFFPKIRQGILPRILLGFFQRIPLGIRLNIHPVIASNLKLQFFQLNVQ